MSKPAIICVDDEPTVLESLKIELKRALGDTCLIETAESGEEALELFEELQTDQYEIALVFADQMMSGMQGDELLKQIHTLSPQTLNIMLTGHADLETLSTAIRTAQLYRHIAKPWQSEDLQSIVLEAIQSYHHTRKLELQNAKLQETVQALEETVTQLKQSEERLRQENQQNEALSRIFLTVAMQQQQLCQTAQTQVETLEHLNQLKDDFLDAVSHELRSPISNIRMATQMLEVRLQQLEGEDTTLQCSRYFQILRNECQREADLINDLLALIRLDSGNDRLTISAINPNLWIPYIVEPFMERVQEREQHLHLDLPPALPTLSTDLSHLERILIELLTNAWKYTPVGEKITLTAEVVPLLPLLDPPVEPWEVSEFEQSGRGIAIPLVALALPQAEIPSELWISVSNSGIEIPAEEQERIFNQFYRISNGNSWQGGTGLGLTIVKKRVEKLQGRISVISQHNQTTFTIKLPLHFSSAHL